MKVLWFSNTPANADEYFDMELRGTGGWLKALNFHLQNHVNLNVAFYSNRKLEPFKYQKTKYFPIYDNSTILKKILGEFGKQYNKDKEDLKIYLEIIKAVNPDIIHIHGTENPFGCIINEVKVPVVVSIQGNITVYYHKFFSGFDKKFLKIKTRNFLTLKRIIFPFSFEAIYKSFGFMSKRELGNLQKTRFIIGRTDWDRRITRIMAPKSKYFHNDEILRQSFLNYKWNEPDDYNDQIIIHTTTSNVFYKGFETLSESLILLNNLGLNCVWQVAGISKEDLICKLTIEKLGLSFLPKNLILLGNLNETSLVKAMLQAHLYVGISHIENSPNSLCEAMVLGMPCISTFVGGTGSLLIDKESGILIQSGDPWSMAGAILELVQDDELRQKIVKNSKNASNKRHNPGKIVNDLVKIYNEIILDFNNGLRLD